MAEMIKDPHEKNQIKALSDSAYILYRQLTELDIQFGNLGGEPCLAQIVFVRIDTEDPLSAPPLHFERIETSIAPNVEDSLPAEVRRDGIPKMTVFDLRIVTQEVIGRGM
jgi:hypothetical protein